MSLNSRNNGSDIVITMIALCVMLLAGGISIATISTDQNSKSFTNSSLESVNPFGKAEQAAVAGIKAARGHIECHGIKESGSLPEQFYVNGGRFEVHWDDVNLDDSTVFIVSKGYYKLSSDDVYTSQLESEMKVNLLTSHNTRILGDYYGNHPKNIEILQEDDK